MPPRIFISVDLPAPLAPTSAVFSLGVISQSAFSNKRRGPNRLPAPESCSIGLFYRRELGASPLAEDWLGGIDPFALRRLPLLRISKLCSNRQPQRHLRGKATRPSNTSATATFSTLA